MRKFFQILCKFWLVAFTTFFIFSACFVLPLEEETLSPPLAQDFTPAQHFTISVSRGNLQRYHTLTPRIVPAVEIAVSFDVPDVYIQAVHVEVGDEVMAGDIIAELDREAFARALYLAEREIAAANINITHLYQRQPLSDLAAMLLGEALDEQLYSEARQGFHTELAVRQLATARLREEDSRRVLRAPMDGTITYALAFRPGDLSRTDVNVVTIADETQSIFSVIGRESRYLIPGDVHTIFINQEPYEAIVIDQEAWGIPYVENQALLAFYDGGLYHFPERTFISLHLVLEEVIDVINVPREALHRVSGRYFVFVIGEDGLRVMRDVVTGMVGNNGIEIISGLSEGDIVALN